MVLPFGFLIYWATILMKKGCGRQARLALQIKTNYNKLAELMS
jgi:hypothetical protein